MSASGIIEDARNYAGGWVAQADGLMSTISNLTGTSLDYGILPSGAYALVEAVANLPTAIGSAPAVPGLSLASPAVADVPDAAEIGDLGNIVLPTLEAVAPVLNMNTAIVAYAETAYQSEALIQMTTLLLGQMVNGGYTLNAATEQALASVLRNQLMGADTGDDPLFSALRTALLADDSIGLNPLDEQAFWNRARERELLQANQSISEADRFYASRGFNQPPGALFGAAEAARAKADLAMNSLSRDFALKRAELVIQNRQFNVQQRQQFVIQRLQMAGSLLKQQQDWDAQRVKFSIEQQQFSVQQLREIEGMLMQHLAGQQSRKLEAAKAVYQFSLELYQQQLAAFNHRLEASSLQIKTAMERAQLAISGHNLKLEHAKAVANIAVTEAEVRLKAYGLDVDKFKVNASTLLEQASLKVRQAEANTRTANVAMDENIKKAQLQLEKAKSEADVKVRAAVSGAEVYSRLITAALSSVNALATVSE